MWFKTNKDVFDCREVAIPAKIWPGEKPYNRLLNFRGCAISDWNTCFKFTNNSLSKFFVVRSCQTRHKAVKVQYKITAS